MVVLYMMFLCILGWIVFLVGPPEAQPGASLFSDKGFVFLMVLWGLNLFGILICKGGSDTWDWDDIALGAGALLFPFCCFPGLLLPYICAVIILELFGDLWIIAAASILFVIWGWAFAAVKLNWIEPGDLFPKVPAKQADEEQPTNARTIESGPTRTAEPVPVEPNRSSDPASNNGDQSTFNSASPGEATRTWTDRQGLEVDAAYIGLIRETRVVVLRRSRDQRVFEIPIARLSDADQEYVRALTEPDAVHTTE